MKKILMILMIVVALALPALMALVAIAPASAAPVYEGRVEDPTAPLTMLGANYPVGTSITITVRVTNTGTAYWGPDVALFVFVTPNPEEPAAEYVYWGWILTGIYPGQTYDLTGPDPALQLNYAGTFEVKVVVLRDSNADGLFTYPDEMISNEATDTFTVGTAGDYSASVEIVSIQAAVLGAFGAIAGGLAGLRFFF